MVKVIAGRKGTGKTKQMIEMVNHAVHEEAGVVACIERGRALTFDLHYSIRLVEANNYDIKSFEFFRGFISGMYACNFDLSHIFIDSLCKTVPADPLSPQTVTFLDWLEAFSTENDVKFTVMLTTDAENLPDGIRKYC